MQMLWFSATGTDATGRARARAFAAVMQVFSRGEVRLRSDHALDDPIVEFRMLSDERDRERLRDGVRRLIDLVQHPAVVAIVDEVHAGNDPLDALETDADIDAWLATNVNDYVHAVGTCRMGAEDDPAAVVGLDGRVHGFGGLRVCDASVMPDIPRANTHLTTVVIAERIAASMRSRAASA
jgi:choline dehydrogenase-like flavoprotein